jgi:DUF1680 family protein
MGYAETCAAVAAARLAPRLGDVPTERRIVHNALLAGVSAAGTEWFYSSPLAATPGGETNPWLGRYDFSGNSLVERFPARRLPWYDVTCCPTNLTRWLAALPWWHGSGADPVAEALRSSPEVLVGHPQGEATRGCVAVELGPFVLCAEEVDHPWLGDAAAGLTAVGEVAARPAPVGVAVTAELTPIGWEGPTYGGRERRGAPSRGPLVPFHAWANRGTGAMTVWFRDTRSPEGREA